MNGYFEAPPIPRWKGNDFRFAFSCWCVLALAGVWVVVWG